MSNLNTITLNLTKQEAKELVDLLEDELKEWRESEPLLPIEIKHVDVIKRLRRKTVIAKNMEAFREQSAH